jgi:hypothetical protein
MAKDMAQQDVGLLGRGKGLCNIQPLFVSEASQSLFCKIFCGCVKENSCLPFLSLLMISDIFKKYI